MKRIIINNERIKTRGAKYFHYHGKRLLIDDYLEKNSNNASPVNGDTLHNVKETIHNDIETIQNIKSTIPLIDTPINNTDAAFHGMKVTCNNKNGDIIIEENIYTNTPAEAPKEKTKSTKSRAPSEGSGVLDSPSEARINATQTSKLNILATIAPFALIAGAFLIGNKKDKGRDNTGREDSW